jgi:hypothetical protein
MNQITAIRIPHAFKFYEGFGDLHFYSLHGTIADCSNSFIPSPEFDCLSRNRQKILKKLFFIKLIEVRRLHALGLIKEYS